MSNTISSNNSIEDQVKTAEKRRLIEHHKTEREWKNIQRSIQDEQELSNFNIDVLMEEASDSNYVKLVVAQIEDKVRLLKQKLPFINQQFTELCPLCPGGIYLMGAISGTGKSTTAAAIAHGLYREGKKTVIISNEEMKGSILARIACAELGVDFNLYNTDRVVQSIRANVAKQIKEVSKFVNVSDDSMNTTRVEAIETMIKSINERGEHSLIIIDFAQRIVHSTKNPNVSNYEALMMLKNVLTDYAQHAKIPIVLMSQLKSIDSNEQERDVENRIKLCKALYEMASAVIEVIRLKGFPISVFYVDKGRFSRSQVSAPCKFENGRYIFMTKAEVCKLKEEIRMKNAEDTLKSLQEKEEDDNGVL